MRSTISPRNRELPDWFRECSTVLKSLFEERNGLYSKWLSTRRERATGKFVSKRRDVRRATREAKNTWCFGGGGGGGGEAAEVQVGRHEKIVWRCIWDIQ